MHANGCGTLLSENFHVYWWPYLPQKDNLQSRHSYDAKGLSSPLSRSLAETQSGSWQTADPGFALSLSLHLSCPLGHFICM